ncbi:hypothetical protein ACWC5C_18725 [Streptomyces sp. NPDC001700]
MTILRMRVLVAAVIAGVLTASLTGCEDDNKGKSGGDTPAAIGASGLAGGTDGSEEPPPISEGGRNGGAGDDGVLPDGLTTRQRLMLDNLPESGAVMAAGEYLQRFTTCETYSIDPSDTRYYPMDATFDESWGVRFRGTCDDGGGDYIRVFWTGPGDGMKTFQKAYRADLAKRIKNSPNAGIDGGFGVGKDFAVIAADPDTLRDLSSSHLLVLNCNPNYQPTGDTSTAPALVDDCVLTDDFTD